MSNLKDTFTPDWSEEAPQEQSYRSIFKWGSPTAFKHPNVRLYQMLKQRLGLTDEHFHEKQNEGLEQVICEQPVTLSANQIEHIQAIVGDENITADAYSRVKYATGKTTEEAFSLRQGIVDKVADLVVHPRHKQDVRDIVAFCHQEKIPIYAYGGGSSVNFGFQPIRGGITLVMSTHMNQVVELNEKDQTICVQAGMMGPAYEMALNEAPQKLGTKKKYTGGHFPQSFEYSTVGGWVLTLGSGQQSSYYGDAYDLVISQEYVTPTGSFTTRDYPATATGPKVNDIMKGSEGCFGILVEVTMKIFHYQPETQKNFTFIFPSWETAVDACKEISQGEFGMPSVLRISDPEESDVALKLYGIEGTILDKWMSFRGYKPQKRCLLIGHTEGEKDFSKLVKKKIKKICKSLGGMSLTGYPVTKWKEGRFRDPYMREDLHDFGISIDTLEASVTWDQLHQVHQQVRAFIKKRPHTICMTHSSHFYAQGTNLYFIFMTPLSDIGEFQELHRGIVEEIIKSGASLSHHHGVGKMLAPWMETHLGIQQLEVLRAIKRHFDPHNIMNPGGQLALDCTPQEGKG